MKSLRCFSVYLNCALVLVACFFAACKRDIPPLPLEETTNTHAVTFHLSGFTSDITPLRGAQAKSQSALGRKVGLQASRGIEPGLEPQYLYYWSFNDETLEPDIAVDEETAQITFEAVADEPTFPNSTFSVDTYPGGKAFSLRGGQTVELTLPMQGVESLTTFAFDVSSSNTGPKDFALTYSLDGGVTYEALSESNPFDDMGDQKRNSYEFDLTGVVGELTAGLLMLTFEFLAGDREGAGDYNESQGTVRLDNIRLSGIYNGITGGGSSEPDLLRYYVFAANDGNLVEQRELSMTELEAGNTVAVELEEGTYDVLFVAYRSDEGILLLEGLTNARDFYLGQHFNDRTAVTYAALLEDLAVTDADVNESVVLNRCYSLVEFEFTDLAVKLDVVDKIVISRTHDNYFYTPFGPPADLPVSDRVSLVFDDFTSPTDYRIGFHQFLGLLEGTNEVTYELTAYGRDDQVLGMVTVSQDISSGVRLLFRGQLLGQSGSMGGFGIEINTDWRERLELEF